MFPRKRQYPFEDVYRQLTHDELVDATWQRPHGPSQTSWTDFNPYMYRDVPQFQSVNWFPPNIGDDASFQPFSRVHVTGPWQAGQLLPPNEPLIHDSDSAPSVNEGDICFGSIPNLKAQLRIRPPARHDASSAPSQCFDILKYGEFYALDSLGSKFAILSKKLCQDIQALQQNRDLHLRAFVSRDQWLQVVQEWYEEKDAAVVAFDMNIYGRRLQATEVGRALSSAKLFLQRPLHGTHGILYYNPHYLHTDEILGNEVLETPVIFPEEQSDESLVEIHEQRSPTEEVCQPNDDAEIDTILNSLSHHSFLVKSAADKRIKSSLLDHQAEALDFIFRRETGNIPPEMSLWSNADSDLEEKLFQHSITGAKSMLPRDAKGGILADDMGLGKTLVILSTIAGSLGRASDFVSKSQRKDHGTLPLVASRSTLVICPSSLLIDSWIDEIRKHTYPGSITFHKHHGQGRQEENSQKQLLGNDIVFTTYATLATELRKGRSGILRCIHWFRVVLDEAHEIRNPSTKQYQVTAELQAEHRWCLTGTPIQNSINDLGALASFLRLPILENPTTFHKFIASPSTYGIRKRFQNFRLLLGSICLRRTRELLGLPDPKPQLRRLEFSPSERDKYDEIQIQCRQEIDKAVSGHGNAKLNSTVLESLLRLRLFCNNGAPRPDTGSVSPVRGLDPDEILSYLQQIGETGCIYCPQTIYTISDSPNTGGGHVIPGCLHLVCSTCMSEFRAGGSRCTRHALGDEERPINLEVAPANGTTLQARPQYPTKLLAFLSDISTQLSHKSIVFSSWKKTLGLIGELLTSQGIPFYCIHGSLLLSERIRILKEFRPSGGANILLMTLGTGAVGLNLAVATRIYLMEPQWNPSVELQAIGRSLRLGQTEEVTIVRYIMKSTIEDSNILSRQEAKLQLAGGGFEKRKRGARTERYQSLLGFFGVDQI